MIAQIAENISSKPVFQSKEAVEVSLPHILNINTSIALSNVTVNLFNAFSSLNNNDPAQQNYGNPQKVGGNFIIAISYLSNNPKVPFTYPALLASTWQIPIMVGVTRISTVTSTQANHPLYRLRNPGVGKFEGESSFPKIEPNQYVDNITYIKEKYKIDAFTLLSYRQNLSDANVQLWFYGHENIDVTRAFSNQKVVQEYGEPPTGITNEVSISAGVLRGTSVRSASLL